MKKYRFRFKKNRLNLRRLEKRRHFSSFNGGIQEYEKSREGKEILRIFSSARSIFNFFNKLPIPLMISRSERVLYVNGALCETFNCKPEKLIGNSIYEFVLPEYVRVVKERYRERERGRKKYVRYFAKGKTFDGKLIVGYVFGTFFDIGGKRYIFSIIIDVTREELLREKLFLFKDIIDNLPLSVMVTNDVPEIEFVNSYFEGLTGYSYEEVYGKNPNILKSGLTPQKTYEDLWSTLINGNKWEGEFINKKKNGELYREKALIYPLIGKEGSKIKYVGIKSDITEEKIAFLEDLKEDIYGKIRSFAYSVSHFTRNFLLSLNFLKSLFGNEKEFLKFFDKILEDVDKFKNELDSFILESGGGEDGIELYEGLKMGIKKYGEGFLVPLVLDDKEVDIGAFNFSKTYLDLIFLNVSSILEKMVKKCERVRVSLDRCYGDCGKTVLSWEDGLKLRGREFVVLKFLFEGGEVSDENFKLFESPFIYVGGGKINSEITSLYLIAEKVNGFFFVRREPLEFLLFFPVKDKAEILREKIEEEKKIIIFSDDMELANLLGIFLRSFGIVVYVTSLKGVEKYKFENCTKVIFIGDIVEEILDNAFKCVSERDIIVISKNKRLKEKYKGINFIKYKPDFYKVLEILGDF